MLSDRQGLIAVGVTEGLPSFAVEQAALDARLEAEPERLKPMTPAEIEQLELRRELGV